MNKFLKIFKLVLLTLGLGSTTATAENNTLIILDGSGSMWGQIAGRPKLSIARGPLRDVVALVPPSAGTGVRIVSKADA